MKGRALQLFIAFLLIAFCGTAIAQGGAETGQGRGTGYGRAAGANSRGLFRDRGAGAHRISGCGAGAGMGLMAPGMGKFWKNSALVQQLGVTEAQIKDLDKIFLDHRTRLIDLRAALQQEELKLEPLVQADAPNESQITGQIEKVAQARANLEKSHALMMLAVRKVLTPDQWHQLQTQRGRMHKGPQQPAPAQ